MGGKKAWLKLLHKLRFSKAGRNKSGGKEGQPPACQQASGTPLASGPSSAAAVHLQAGPVQTNQSAHAQPADAQKLADAQSPMATWLLPPQHRPHEPSAPAGVRPAAEAPTAAVRCTASHEHSDASPSCTTSASSQGSHEPQSGSTDAAGAGYGAASVPTSTSTCNSTASPVSYIPVAGSLHPQSSIQGSSPRCPASFDFGVQPCKVVGCSMQGPACANTPTCLLPAFAPDLQACPTACTSQEQCPSVPEQCPCLSLAPLTDPASDSQGPGSASLASFLAPSWPAVLVPLTGLGPAQAWGSPDSGAMAGPGLQQPLKLRLKPRDADSGSSVTLNDVSARTLLGDHSGARRLLGDNSGVGTLLPTSPAGGGTLAQPGTILSTFHHQQPQQQQQQQQQAQQQVQGEGLQGANVPVPAAVATSSPGVHAAQRHEQAPTRHHRLGNSSQPPSSCQPRTELGRTSASLAAAGSKPPRLRGHRHAASQQYSSGPVSPPAGHFSTPCSPAPRTPTGPSSHTQAAAGAGAPPARPAPRASASSSPEIQMLWPLCVTTLQGDAFIAAKVSGGAGSACTSGTQALGACSSGAVPPSGTSLGPQQQQQARVRILVDASPLAALSWDPGAGVVGGRVPACPPALLTSPTGLQVACAFATCQGDASSIGSLSGLESSQGSGGGTGRGEGGAGGPGPAVSLLCVPACVSQELHLLFALWVDAQLAEDAARAIHEGGAQYPSLTDLHGLTGVQLGGRSADSFLLPSPEAHSSPCARGPSDTPHKALSPTSSAICKATLLDGLFALREHRSFSSLHPGPAPHRTSRVSPGQPQPLYARSRTSHLPIIPRPRKPSWVSPGDPVPGSPCSTATPHTSKSFNVWDSLPRRGAGAAAVGSGHISMSQSLPASQPSYVHTLCSSTPSHTATVTTPTDSLRAPPAGSVSGNLGSGSSEQEVGRLALGDSCPPPWLLSPELAQAALGVWAKQYLPLARDIAYLILCVPSVFDHQRLSLCGEGDAAGLDLLNKTWDRKTYCSALARILLLLETHHMWQTLAVLLTHAGEHGVHLKCRGARVPAQDIHAAGLQQLLQGARHEDITIGYDSSTAAPTDTSHSSCPLLQLQGPGPAVTMAEACGLGTRRSRTTVDAPVIHAGGEPCRGSGWRDDTARCCPQALLASYQGAAPACGQRSTRRQRRASLPTPSCDSAPCALPHTRSNTSLLGHAGARADGQRSSMELPRLRSLARPCSAGNGRGSSSSSLAVAPQALFSGCPSVCASTSVTPGTPCGDGHCCAVSLQGPPGLPTPGAGDASIPLPGLCALDTNEDQWAHVEFLDQTPQQERRSREGPRGPRAAAPHRASSWCGPPLSPCASLYASCTPSMHPGGSTAGVMLETVMSSGAEQWMQLLAGTSSSALHASDAADSWPGQQEGADGVHAHAGSLLRTSLSMLPHGAAPARAHSSVGNSPGMAVPQSAGLQTLRHAGSFFGATCSGAASAAGGLHVHGSSGGKAAPAAAAMRGPVLLSSNFVHLRDVDPWRWHARVMAEQLALILVCMVLVLCMYL